jgi:hypothetical protein
MRAALLKHQMSGNIFALLIITRLNKPVEQVRYCQITNAEAQLSHLPITIGSN